MDEHNLRGIVLALAASAANAESPAPHLVIDKDAGSSALGALFSVDATSGIRTLVSDFGDAILGPLGLDPSSVVLETEQSALVLDIGAGTNGRGALFRVDLVTGLRTLVSDFGIGAVLGVNPAGLVLDGGTALVIDPDGGTGSRGALVRVDLTTGLRTLVSDFGQGAPLGTGPVSVALETAGTALVLDPDAGLLGLGTLTRIDLDDGARSLVSDFGNLLQGLPPPLDPVGLALDQVGDVLVLDQGLGSGLLGGVLRIDPVTGFRSLAIDLGLPLLGLLPVLPVSLALESTGQLLVVDTDAGTGGLGVLFRIDLVTEVRVTVSDFGDPAQGPVGENPASTCTGGTPPGGGTSPGGGTVTCLGQAATLVGDDGDNILIGTPGPDVIAGQGGADIIEGGDGNDLLCGGDGNDVLIGGNNADQVDGGSGSDFIIGGKGRDRLAGGAGNDRIIGGGASDILVGGTGRDRLAGGARSDILIGGSGRDRLNGGPGTDRCRSAEQKTACER